ncbi:MAG: YiiD C-terminal domain-containing protein [Dokdonella sp.]
MNAVQSSVLESVLVDPAKKLEIELRRDIPLARMMDIRITSWDGSSVTLVAPAEPNINDKGCAFGGSLASLMTIAGWALIRLAMDQRGVRGDVYVQDSQIRYLAPVFGELRATAQLGVDDSFDTYFSTLAARGKARLGATVEVAGAQDAVGSNLSARYVAFAKQATKQIC